MAKREKFELPNKIIPSFRTAVKNQPTGRAPRKRATKYTNRDKKVEGPPDTKKPEPARKGVGRETIDLQ